MVPLRSSDGAAGPTPKPPSAPLRPRAPPRTRRHWEAVAPGDARSTRTLGEWVRALQAQAGLLVLGGVTLMADGGAAHASGVLGVPWRLK